MVAKGSFSWLRANRVRKLPRPGRTVACRVVPSRLVVPSPRPGATGGRSIPWVRGTPLREEGEHAFSDRPDVRAAGRRRPTASAAPIRSDGRAEQTEGL